MANVLVSPVEECRHRRNEECGRVANEALAYRFQLAIDVFARVVQVLPYGRRSVQQKLEYGVVRAHGEHLIALLQQTEGGRFDFAKVEARLFDGEVDAKGGDLFAQDQQVFDFKEFGVDWRLWENGLEYILIV